MTSDISRRSVRVTRYFQQSNFASRAPSSASTQTEQRRLKSFGALTQEHTPDITCLEYALNYSWQFMLHLNMLYVWLCQDYGKLAYEKNAFFFIFPAVESQQHDAVFHFIASSFPLIQRSQSFSKLIIFESFYGMGDQRSGAI